MALVILDTFAPEAAKAAAVDSRQPASQDRRALLESKVQHIDHDRARA